MDRSLPKGELFLLDSDYRGGALFYLLVSSVLLGFSIYSSILFEKIRQKPSQSITYGESTAMFVLSIIVAIFSGVAWIYAIIKLALNSEQRSAIYRNAVAFANAPAGGIPKGGRVTPQRLYVKQDPVARKQEELNQFVPKRDLFVDQIFSDSDKYKNPVEVGGGYK
jgi:hypothetical protein